jgi:type I restriction enzyme S subunit
MATSIKHVISELDQGWSPQCESFPVESAQDWGVLKVGCVNGGHFEPRENKALPSSLDPQPELAVENGDVLISRANTRELVGSAALVSRDYPNLMLSDKLYRLRVDATKSTPEFITRFLASGAARQVIELEATGASSSMLNIAQSTIRELGVAIPDLAEQAEICRFIETEIDKLDALIADAKQAITLLQERRTSLISATVTGKIDVRGLVEQEAA